ncbi:uncharacterized protein PGTG_11909 [Puccinia graminis f. sp. tritici CRL 75-36-700-3]|uniref:RING-type domain-containing protein n=1 Tax=Puccinia graminis f. sp. tritici (strain CRL 75-36-700-3 / race SCCL) TaxID=418459 RepID=E3KMM8_PUCGT|nr:uncharacterized protein PGTG_11909 [Puccinia graminis f. sp. tritici CRL 75-36-700-3]EFP85553.1 hypothetical protein PGTG_11909 [Puccinia graminis f. sp. tritici CRL 75-36-700-3]
MCIPRVASVNQQGPSRRFLPGLYWIWKVIPASFGGEPGERRLAGFHPPDSETRRSRWYSILRLSRGQVERPSAQPLFRRATLVQFLKAFSVTISSHHVALGRSAISALLRFFQPESLEIFVIDCNLLQAAYQSTARPVVHDRAGELDGVKQATNSNAISASTQTVSSSPVWPPPAGSNTLHQHSKRELPEQAEEECSICTAALRGPAPSEYNPNPPPPEKTKKVFGVKLGSFGRSRSSKNIEQPGATELDTWPCAHVFHKWCKTSYLKSRPDASCPICGRLPNGDAPQPPPAARARETQDEIPGMSAGGYGSFPYPHFGSGFAHPYDSSGFEQSHSGSGSYYPSPPYGGQPYLPSEYASQAYSPPHHDSGSYGPSHGSGSYGNPEYPHGLQYHGQIGQGSYVYSVPDSPPRIQDSVVDYLFGRPPQPSMPMMPPMQPQFGIIPVYPRPGETLHPISGLGGPFPYPPPS